MPLDAVFEVLANLLLDMVGHVVGETIGGAIDLGVDPAKRMGGSSGSVPSLADTRALRGPEQQHFAAALVAMAHVVDGRISTREHAALA